MQPKNEKEIQAIRESGRMLAHILVEIKKTLSAGMSGIDVDELVMREMRAFGAIPAFLGYQGFPKAICISVNDAVVHGIPDERAFQAGDIIGFDCGVLYDGMITDAARTLIVGGNTHADNRTQKLLIATQRSLNDAINAVVAGGRVGNISAAAQRVLDDGGYGIVRDLVGHGVGHKVHEGPEIPNYGVAGTGKILKEGMTLAIEPMATLGGWQVVMDPDGWTIRTRDGSLAAQFEDTVLVTSDGCEILTRLP